MPTTYTPLRYPGGKSSIYPIVSALIRNECLGDSVYTEPFAGGAGLAIKLLLKGDVNRIHLNDLDPAVHLFWESVVYRTDELNSLIVETPVTIDEWRRQRQIALAPELHTPLEVGFSTLFLNRTNVSGVLRGGVIGGLSQDGSNPMTARFNKTGLIKKINAIADRGGSIAVSGFDAMELIDNYWLADNAFLNIDPPYVKKGPLLYRNSFTREDHLRLRDSISKLQVPWILTYDDSEFIREAYSSWTMENLAIYYSIGSVRKTNEVMFKSNDLLQASNFIE